MNKDQSSGGEQEPELSQGEKGSDDVTGQADFMDFSVTELAEQLTRQDAVSVNRLHFHANPLNPVITY